MLEEASEEAELSQSKTGDGIFNVDFRPLKYLQMHKEMMCEVTLLLYYHGLSSVFCSPQALILHSFTVKAPLVGCNSMLNM